MYLVAIAWMYVVLMMSLAEATAANGSVLGALMTFALYGLLPLSILIYIMRTPARKRARLAAEGATQQESPRPIESAHGNLAQTSARMEPADGAPPTIATPPPPQSAR